MSRLSIVEIVTLAKAGFKASDIKELMNSDVPDTQQPEQNQTEQTDQQTQTTQPETEHPAPNDTETPAKATGQPVESTEDQKKIAELEKQIVELQKKNQSTDVSGNVPDPQDTINDIVRGFM